MFSNGTNKDFYNMHDQQVTSQQWEVDGYAPTQSATNQSPQPEDRDNVDSTGGPWHLSP